MSPVAYSEKMPNQNASENTQRILVMGQNPKTRAFAFEILSACGYSVIEATSTEYADTVIERLNGGIDLIIGCCNSDEEERQMKRCSTSNEIPLLVVRTSGYWDRQSFEGIALRARLALESAAPKKSIMVVAQDESERNLISTLLETAGYQVMQAANGRAALTLIASNRPDVVLTDIVMAEKDGFEVIEELRKHYFTITPIAMSGGPRAEGYLSVARLMGAEATLKKPLDVDQLLRTLNRFLRSKHK